MTAVSAAVVVVVVIVVVVLLVVRMAATMSMRGLRAFTTTTAVHALLNWRRNTLATA
jgi:hypothetical protein